MAFAAGTSVKRSLSEHPLPENLPTPRRHLRCLFVPGPTPQLRRRRGIPRPLTDSVSAAAVGVGPVGPACGEPPISLTGGRERSTSGGRSRDRPRG